jgi:C1A family cysteine protease/uncharacterized tellurite resistance protein B-like protein
MESIVRLKYLVDIGTGKFKAVNGCQTAANNDRDSDVLEGSGDYQATRFKEEQLPPMVSMIHLMTPVENQALANSCTANAVVGGYEYVMNRVGEEVDFSRLFVYYNARMRESQIMVDRASQADVGDRVEVLFDKYCPGTITKKSNGGYHYVKFDDGDKGWFNLYRRHIWFIPKEEEADEEDKKEEEEEAKEEEEAEEEEPTGEAQPLPIEDQGSTIRLAISSIDVYGVCKEETWDYKLLPGEKVESLNDPPHEDAYAEAKNLKNRSAFRWDTAEEVDIDLFTMKHCLAEGYPFVFGLKLFKDFDVALKHGRVPMPDLDTDEGRESHGNHAMLCVGYKDSAQVFIVRNSWGDNWGDRGYCYIPYKYMTDPNLIHDVWKIKGHFELDFTDGIWFEEDEDFGDEFYADVELPENMVFSLEEAIAVLAFIGSKVDGISKEELSLLFRLYDEYHIDRNTMGEKVEKLSALGDGLDACHDAAVQVILAYNEKIKAYKITAEFAFADGKITAGEEKYWEKLAEDLGIDPEEAHKIFEELFEQNPDTVAMVLKQPLTRFSRGVKVEELQGALIKAGYKLTVTGMYGPFTRRAVIDFQKKNDLKADGIVGQKTWSAIFSN